MNTQKGWKLVPVEPTQEMLAAADIEHAARGLVSIALISYRAMLDAAPTPPAQDDEALDRIAVLEAENARLREALELLRDTASQEWQEADGSRRGATDNSGERMWFVSQDVMGFVTAALENTDAR